MKQRVSLGERVLVVEADQKARGLVGSWLEEAGFEVIRCAGPQAPEYSCPWDRGQACVLAYTADAIVLDIWLESDTALRGNPGSEVFVYYLSLGKPVVALTDGDDATVPVLGERTIVLSRLPGREALVAAVRTLLRARRAESSHRL